MFLHLDLNRTKPSRNEEEKENALCTFLQKKRQANHSSSNAQCKHINGIQTIFSLRIFFFSFFVSSEMHETHKKKTWQNQRKMAIECGHYKHRATEKPNEKSKWK